MPQRYRQRPYVPAKDPLSAIPPSRHPFQFWAMLALMLGGVSNMADPTSFINQLLWRPVGLIWSGTMILGGFLAMVAAFWPDRITGLLLERIALFAAATTLLSYGGGVLYTYGSAAAVAGTMALSLFISSIWRIVHVTRELRILRLFVARHYSPSRPRQTHRRGDDE